MNSNSVIRLDDISLEGGITNVPIAIASRFYDIRGRRFRQFGDFFECNGNNSKKRRFVPKDAFSVEVSITGGEYSFFYEVNFKDAQGNVVQTNYH